MSTNADNPVLDEASQEFDDFLDGLFANTDITVPELIEALEDFAYRAEVAAKSLR